MVKHLLFYLSDNTATPADAAKKQSRCPCLDLIVNSRRCEPDIDSANRTFVGNMMLQRNLSFWETLASSVYLSWKIGLEEIWNIELWQKLQLIIMFIMHSSADYFLDYLFALMQKPSTFEINSIYSHFPMKVDQNSLICDQPTNHHWSCTLT